MSTALKFVILTHISSKVGYGHLNRCIVLGKEIKKRGNKISLIVTGKKDDANFFSNYSWIKFFGKKKIKFPSADICIVDNYCYKNEYYKKLRAFYDKILIFDDYKYIVPNYVSGVINPNLYADKKFYCPGIRLFTGRKYLLIRNEFFNINRIKNSNRILLCVGGSDPENQMDRLISILIKVSKRPIDAVFGPGFENLNVIKRWKRHPRVFTHKAVKNISKLMSKAFYALSSSGSIIYELTAVGVPTICMALAENQKLIGEHFSKLNLVAYLGLFNEINNKKLENKIKIFEKNIENNNGKFSEKKIILLNGAKNLARDLEEWALLKKEKFMSPYSKKEIEFEYNLSSKMKKEHDKVHWGSKKSMYNRYNFVMKELPFPKTKNWLDVGSGIGSFQYLISKNFSKIKAVGLELSSELIKVARKKKILNAKISPLRGDKNAKNKTNKIRTASRRQKAF